VQIATIVGGGSGPGEVETVTILNPGFAFNGDTTNPSNPYIVYTNESLVPGSPGGLTLRVNEVTHADGPPGYWAPLTANIDFSGNDLTTVFPALSSYPVNNEKVTMTDCTGDNFVQRAPTGQLGKRCYSILNSWFGPHAFANTAGNDGVYKNCSFGGTVSQFSSDSRPPFDNERAMVSFGYNGNGNRNQTFEDCHFDNIDSYSHIIGIRSSSVSFGAGFNKGITFRRCTSKNHVNHGDTADPPLTADSISGAGNLRIVGVEFNGGDAVLVEDCEVSDFLNTTPASSSIEGSNCNQGMVFQASGGTDAPLNNVTVRRCRISDLRDESVDNGFTQSNIGIFILNLNVPGQGGSTIDGLIVEDCTVSGIHTVNNSTSNGFLVIGGGVPNSTGMALFRNCTAMDIQGVQNDIFRTNGFMTLSFFGPEPTTAQYENCRAINCGTGFATDASAINNSYRNCTAENNDRSGFAFTTISGFILKDCTSTGNDVGLETAGDHYDNKFCNNQICNNTTVDRVGPTMSLCDCVYLIRNNDLPLTITKPGCYKLCEDAVFLPDERGMFGTTPVVAADVQAAITIESSDVELDLGCHKLSQDNPPPSGQKVATSASSGISTVSDEPPSDAQGWAPPGIPNVGPGVGYFVSENPSPIPPFPDLNILYADTTGFPASGTLEVVFYTPAPITVVVEYSGIAAEPSRFTGLTGADIQGIVVAVPGGTTITLLVDATESTIPVLDASAFKVAPDSFTVATATGEQTIAYTGKTATSFTGCTGGVAGTITGDICQILGTITSQQVPFCIGVLVPDMGEETPLKDICIKGDCGTISQFSMYGICAKANIDGLKLEGFTVRGCGHMASRALRPTVYGFEYLPHTDGTAVNGALGSWVPGFGPSFGVAGIAIGECGGYGMGPEFFEDLPYSQPTGF
jgi:hypothetical protein